MAYLDNKRIQTNKRNKIVCNITIPISITNSLKFIQFIFSENQSITKRSIINLYKYLKKINEEIAYQNNYTALYYFRFLKECCSLIVDQRLNINLDNYEGVLIDYFNDNVSENDIPDEVIIECINNITELKDRDLSNDDIQFLSNWIESRLTNSYIYENIDDIQNLINELKIDDGKNNKKLLSNFEYCINSLYKDLHSAKINANHAAKDISFNNKDSLMNGINNTLKKYNSPSNKLTTGYRAFNKMINGGFEGARQYIFFGLPKSFKSGNLLNMALSICKNNPNYKTKDPTKRPMVVYFSMENDSEETMQRIFTYLTGSEDLHDFSPEKAFDLLNKEINEKYNISLRILFRPNRSVDTSYLYNIVEDMELDGEECICMIQDYTKRIRSTTYNQDLRLELGDITNEFSVFSKEMNIPLITAAQLNREAYRIMEAMSNSGKKDIAKALGSSHIGESALILENLDYGFIINKEYDKDSNTSYISYKILASRARHDDEDQLAKYFAQPMENGMKIEEDINSDECIAVENIGGSGLDFGNKKQNTKEDIIKRFNINSKKSKSNDIKQKDINSIEASIEEDIKF